MGGGEGDRIGEENEKLEEADGAEKRWVIRCVRPMSGRRRNMRRRVGCIRARREGI